MMKKLSVVFPIRISEDRIDVLDRLAFHLLDTEISKEDFEFIAVDDGSSAEYVELIKQKCNDLGITYIRIDSEKECFSAGRARNIAAQSVQTPFIMFQDVDLLPYNGFYKQALNECYIQQLDKYADRFVMFGVVYLTEQASKEYILEDEELRKNKFLNYMYENDKDKIEKVSTGTSVTIWRTDHYLCTGGNDPEFAGWGFEDLEYACRAIRRNRKFPLPNVFNEDYKNFMTVQEYKGWKSIYRLYGDLTFNKGMVMFHYWHPINFKGTYQKQRDKNKKVFERKLQDFAKEGIEPSYLPIKNNGKSLVFRSNPWTTSRWISPNLGEITVISEDRFDENILLSYINANRISRVVFHNPYANEKMIELYNAVKKHNIPYLVCERGALRDSVFIDPNGFNAESISYSPERWDQPLSLEKRQKTLDYIIEEKSLDESLEQQNFKISKNDVYKKLGISKGKKILFVPLQRPSDTVIQYFCGPIGTYDNFISLINSLAQVLPRDWEIVVKRHPLEVNDPDLHGVVFANNLNIKSLIEASDSVLLINSGVGVLSLLYDKPTFVAGSAFYNHDGLTYPVKNIEDFMQGLNSYKPDPEKTLRFISYLINDFYSFGKFKTRTVPWVNGTKMTATTDIEYYCVRFPNISEMVLERSVKPTISDSSCLFDRYRNPNNIIRLGLAPKQPEKVVVKPTPKPKQSVTIEHEEIIIANKKALLENQSSNLDLLSIQRKLRKLKNNPKSFLEDSKNPVLKKIGSVIKD